MYKSSKKYVQRQYSREQSHTYNLMFNAVIFITKCQPSHTIPPPYRHNQNLEFQQPKISIKFKKFQQHLYIKITILTEITAPSSVKRRYPTWSGIRSKFSIFPSSVQKQKLKQNKNISMNTNVKLMPQYFKELFHLA